MQAQWADLRQPWALRRSREPRVGAKGIRQPCKGEIGRIRTASIPARWACALLVVRLPRATPAADEGRPGGPAIRGRRPICHLPSGESPLRRAFSWK